MHGRRSWRYDPAMTRLRLTSIAALLLAGCGQHVSGVVRDAATDQPLAGASVELRNIGWGIRDGQLVWDAEKVSRATTNGGGRFAFDEDGGVNLQVRSPNHPTIDTSLCARSPMVVRVGGPYPTLRADRRLLLDLSGAEVQPAGNSSPQTANAADLGLSASGSAGDDASGLRIEAKGGIRLVEGTGAIPPAPPLPYDRAVNLDLGSACGWLFVSDGTSPIAVIQIGAIGWEQDPGGPRRWVMLFTPLPSR